MNLVYDVAVIGAGAAGMAAAISAAERKRKVLLLEKADRPGRKVLASGNGRCNLMNSGVAKYYGDTEFALQVLQNCNREELKSFFAKYGLLLCEESGGLVYPATYQSSSVVSVLKNAMALTGVNMLTNNPVIDVYKNGNHFSIRTGEYSEDEYRADHLIVSCGGKSQPKLGGSDDGYHILQSMGHRIIPVFPALVPLITDEKSISGLSGLRFRCSVSLFRKDRVLHTEEGEVLFTDYGVSGICIMQCARFVSDEDTFLELDLLKKAFPDRADAYDEIKRRAALFSSCSPIWLLNGILPEKLSYAVLKQAGLPMHGEKNGDIRNEQLERIIDTAYGYRIRIKGNRGFEQSQVTAGGADCNEFNSLTMESCIVPGLFAAGEVLNVDGDCGGFNLMFAFASGLLAGRAV